MTTPTKLEGIDVTLAQVVEALGYEKYGVFHETGEVGRLSVDELQLFGSALTGRLKYFYGEPFAPYRPPQDMSLETAERQGHIHMVGSTVADIMISQHVTSNRRSEAV